MWVTWSVTSWTDAGAGCSKRENESGKWRLYPVWVRYWRAVRTWRLKQTDRRVQNSTQGHSNTAVSMEQTGAFPAVQLENGPGQKHAENCQPLSVCLSVTSICFGNGAAKTDAAAPPWKQTLLHFLLLLFAAHALVFSDVFMFFFLSVCCSSVRSWLNTVRVHKTREMAQQTSKTSAIRHPVNADAPNRYSHGRMNTIGRGGGG